MPTISFQALVITDGPIIYQWLQNPLVSKRYTSGVSNLNEYTQKIQRKIESPYEFSYFIMLDNNAIGYIQCYDCRGADPKRWKPYVDDGTRGVDMFIGEDQWRGKGLGGIILKQFVDTIVIAEHHATHIIIDPDTQNIPAIKAYQKAGFITQKTIQDPEGGQKHLMIYQ